LNQTNQAHVYRLPLIVVALAVLLLLQGTSLSRAADSPATAPSPQAVSASSLPSSLLYNGEPLETAPLTVSSWGGGTTDFVNYTDMPAGKKVLKVTTYGLYEGAYMEFNPPGLLGNIRADNSRYLILRLTTVAPTDASAQTPGLQLLHLASQSPVRATTPGSTGATVTTVADTSTEIQSVRLVLNLTNGLSLDTIRVLPPIDPLSPWVNVGIPLTTLAVSDSQVQGAQLRSMVIAGDKTATLYISQISLVSDSTPIQAAIEGSRDADQNSPQTYSARALGGASTLSYTWKFGDDNSTPTGPVVTHTFAAPGSYKVSVTVLDADGIKPGIRTTTTVHVEAQ
jgi:hypothetical protein